MRPCLPASLIATIALAAAFSGSAAAQIRASERGSVSQTIDGTVITIDYSRPQTRGRTNLFGGEVPWGKVWTGANWATTIDLNRDITLNGHDLPAGRYSVWFEVQPDAWTVIIDPEPRRFHLMPPPESEEQLRFSVRPTGDSPDKDVLTWSFTEVRPTGTTLEFAWATTRVALDIGVHPSRRIEVARDFAERYIGTYRLAHGPQLGGNVVDFRITYENERLVARWEGAPNPRLNEVWLVSLGEGMFVPAELEDGELFDIVMDLVFEFEPEGPVTGFELRALGDALWATARRQGP